jgi:hypothetical protein
MDELKFIREYMAVASCGETLARNVFILTDALLEPTRVFPEHATDTRAEVEASEARLAV